MGAGIRLDERGAKKEKTNAGPLGQNQHGGALKPVRQRIDEGGEDSARGERGKAVKKNKKHQKRSAWKRNSRLSQKKI